MAEANILSTPVVYQFQSAHWNDAFVDATWYTQWNWRLGLVLLCIISIISSYWNSKGAFTDLNTFHLSEVSNPFTINGALVAKAHSILTPHTVNEMLSTIKKKKFCYHLQQDDRSLLSTNSSHPIGWRLRTCIVKKTLEQLSGDFNANSFHAFCVPCLV